MTLAHFKWKITIDRDTITVPYCTVLYFYFKHYNIQYTAVKGVKFMK